MVINKDGLITENQNTQDNTLSNELEQTTLNEEIKNFDLNSNNNEFSNSIEYNQKLDECLKNVVISNNAENITNIEPNSITSQNNTSISNLSSNEDENKEKTVETNCLALTVRKDYNFSIAKNTVFKTIRMSVKVAISTLVLNLIKIFF